MSIPDWLEGFVDDAAIFPPGNAPLDRAVAEHAEHRSAEYADLIGGLVVSDLKVPELLDILDERDHEEIVELNLVVTGGAGAIEPAVRWATRAPNLRLRTVEVAVRESDEIAHNARRILTAVDALGAELEEVDVHVEMPRVEGEAGHGWLAALDELAASEVRLKFRTGGIDADLFPSPAELAASIDAALDRELAFKCTAGLHHAIRNTDPDTGITHHGFLNVLLATRACLDGGDPVGVLSETDPGRLLTGVDPAELARTRRWFTSFGCCDVLEPHHDLVELGILDGGSAR